MNNSMLRVLKLEESIAISVIFSVILLAGLVGNLIVLIVYILKFKKTTSAILIIVLAAFDLLTCLFGVPFHIITTLYPLMFVWDGLCKFFSFALTFSIVTSLLILDLVAYDRYRKICTPHARHMLQAQTGRFSVAIILFSGAFSTPMLFVYGTSPHVSAIDNSTRSMCFILQEISGTTFHDVYDICISVVYVLPIVLMTVFHLRVGRRIWKLQDLRRRSTCIAKKSGQNCTTQRSGIELKYMYVGNQKFGNKLLNADGKVGEISTRIDNETVKCEINAQTELESSEVQLNEIKDILDISDSQTIVSDTENENTNMISDKGIETVIPKNEIASIDETKFFDNLDVNVTINKNKQTQCNTNSDSFKDAVPDLTQDVSSFKERHSKNEINITQKKKQITFMFSVITAVFVVSFLPYLTFKLLGGHDREFIESITAEKFITYDFFTRLYFISSVVNPVVYWVLNKKFKKIVKTMCKQVFCCLLK